MSSRHRAIIVLAIVLTPGTAPAQIADKIAVMYAGRIIEYGNARDVLLNPSHPYTIGLLSSTVHGQNRERDIEAIPGSPPDLRLRATGCSFRPRCPRADALCVAPPALEEKRPSRWARCFHPHEEAA